MTIYRVWYGYELEGMVNEDEARRLAGEMKLSSNPVDAPTFEYVEEVDE